MKCGNGVIDPGERCDTALPAPFVGVTCKPVTCQYNFSQATQLYCNGSCTWAGAQDCDQQDANILCKLKTGNPNSVALGWTDDDGAADVRVRVPGVRLRAPASGRSPSTGSTCRVVAGHQHPGATTGGEHHPQPELHQPVT
jgi:hypothetical protein